VENGDHEVCCYVPSGTGKTFSISMEDKGPERAPGVWVSPHQIHIDGVRLMTGPRVHYTKQRLNHRILAGVMKPDCTAFQPLSFANLRVHELESGGRAGSKPSGLGTISILLRWAQCHERIPNEEMEEIPAFTFQNTPVDEKYKQLVGTTHRVLLGDSVRLDKQRIPGFRTTTVEELPILKFTFRYTNRDVLMAKGIMPRPHPREEIVIVDSDVEELPVPPTGKKAKEAKRRRESTPASDSDSEESGDDVGENRVGHGVGSMTREEKELLLELLKDKAMQSNRARSKRVKVEVRYEQGLGSSSPKVK